MKKIFSILSFLIVFSGFSQEYSNGIVVPTGFNIQASTPIDDRFVVADSLSLYDLSNKYDGMFAVTLDEEKRVLWTYNEGEGLWYRAGATDAENISFNDIATQLGETNIQGAIEEIVKSLYSTTVEKFGAVGDGITDDWQAIQDAVNSDYKVINFNNYYRISRPIYVPSNKIISINGTIKPLQGVQTTLSSNGNIGDTVISVTDSSGFLIGQEVIIADDLGSVNVTISGQYAIISDIIGNDITIDRELDIDVKVSENAIIGTFQSVFISMNNSNVAFIGNGIIDSNKSEQLQGYDPVMYNTPYLTGTIEATFAGCGIGLYKSNNTYIGSGLTFQDAPLHNISYLDCKNITVNNIEAKRAYYKNILLFYTDNAILYNLTLKDSDYEDGLTIYRYNKNITVSNITTSGNPRYGITFSVIGIENISIDNVTSDSDGGAIMIGGCKNVRVTNLYAKNSTGTNSIRISGENVYVQAKIEDWNSLYATRVSDYAKNIILELDIIGNTSSPNVNTGLVFWGSASGEGIDGVFVQNSQFRNCKTAISSGSSVVNPKNIVVNSNLFEGNTINIAASTVDNLLIRGNIGVEDYPGYDYSNIINKPKDVPLVVFNQYTESTVAGDDGSTLIHPDLGFNFFDIDDIKGGCSYKGELVLSIENNNPTTVKVIELFGAEIYNNTNPSPDIAAKITFTLDFFNQGDDDIDYKLSWEYLSSGEVLFGEFNNTINSNEPVLFDLIVTGHSTDAISLNKAYVQRLSDADNRNITGKVLPYSEEVKDAVYSNIYVGNKIPNLKTLQAIDEFISELKTSGVWAKFDIFSLFQMNDNTLADFALYDYKRGTFMTAFGGLGYTINGYEGNAVDGYINTNFNPSTSGVNYTLNNASRGTWTTKLGTSQTGVVYTVIDVSSNTPLNGNTNRMVISNNTAQRINQGSSSLNEMADFRGLGLKVINRNDSTNVSLYNNETEVNRTATSISINNATQLLLTSTNGYGDSGLGFYFMGGSLTAQNVADLRTAYLAYLTKIGL